MGKMGKYAEEIAMAMILVLQKIKNENYCITKSLA